MPIYNDKSQLWERGILDLLFLNANVANIGDDTGLRGSTTAGNLYVSLHTADPTAAGDQSTSEVSYTGYARVAVPRSGAGWVRDNSTITNAALITFPQNTGSASGTITHIAVGTEAVGAGKLIYVMEVSSSGAVASNESPKINAGQFSITED